MNSSDPIGLFPKNSMDNENYYLSSHPKMRALKDVIFLHFKRFETRNETTRVVIFSQYRDSVQEIGKMLSTLGPLIKPMSFVGQANSSTGKGGLKQKDQVQIVQTFRDGGFNVLVCTSVGEEGLDIGEVDLIVCFDASKSPTRLVQRMGRTARQRDGRVVFLLTKGKEEQNYRMSCNLQDSVSKNLTDPNKLQPYLYKFSPRMLPKDINPQCFKMNILPTNEQYQRERDCDDVQAGTETRTDTETGKERQCSKELTISQCFRNVIQKRKCPETVTSNILNSNISYDTANNNEDGLTIDDEECSDNQDIFNDIFDDANLAAVDLTNSYIDNPQFSKCTVSLKDHAACIILDPSKSIPSEDLNLQGNNSSLKKQVSADQEFCLDENDPFFDDDWDGNGEVEKKDDEQYLLERINQFFNDDWDGNCDEFGIDNLSFNLTSLKSHHEPVNLDPIAKPSTLANQNESEKIRGEEFLNAVLRDELLLIEDDLDELVQPISQMGSYSKSVTGNINVENIYTSVCQTSPPLPDNWTDMERINKFEKPEFVSKRIVRKPSTSKSQLSTRTVKRLPTLEDQSKISETFELRSEAAGKMSPSLPLQTSMSSTNENSKSTSPISSIKSISPPSSFDCESSSGQSQKQQQRKKTRKRKDNPFIDMEAEVDSDDYKNKEEEEEEETEDENDNESFNDSFVVYEHEETITESQQVRYLRSLNDIEPVEISSSVPSYPREALRQRESDNSDSEDSWCVPNDDVEFHDVGVFTQGMNEARAELLLHTSQSGNNKRKTRKQVHEANKNQPIAKKPRRRIIITSDSSDDEN